MGTALMISHDRFVAVLAALYAVLWTVLAIRPIDRADWALENVLAVLFVIAIVLSYRRFRLSPLSYALIFLFLCVHAIGAHYTYAKVPYDAFFMSITGRSLGAAMGWERNHFDRLAHSLYGLLLVYPLRELLLRVANVRGFWSYFLPLNIVIATSAVFELFEWAAAEVFGGDLGVAYLGTQGDEWDAQRDMALAALGAAVTTLVMACIDMQRQPDFVREWRESLRVKSDDRPGQDEIARL